MSEINKEILIDRLIAIIEDAKKYYIRGYNIEASHAIGRVQGMIEMLSKYYYELTHKEQEQMFELLQESRELFNHIMEDI